MGIKLKEIPAVSMDPALITVREGCDRARKELGDIEELTESIIKNGQISPILITKDNELIAGERRLRACQSIGIPILAIYRHEIDDLTLRELELEENIQRKDMEWQEKINLTREITLIKQEKYGKKGPGRSQEGWSSQDTANLTNKSMASVHADIELAEAMEYLPELASAKTAEDAKKLLRKAKEDVLIAELMRRDKDKSKAYDFADHHYIIGDAIEGLKKLPSGVRHYADVDTPYGIDLDKQKKSQTGTKGLKKIGQYEEWDREIYLDTCKTVATEIYRILSKDAWCTWWFGLEYYAPLKEMLEKVGFALDPIPSIWYAGASSAQTNQPQILMGKSYDTFFMCRKGKPVLAKPGRHNVFEYPKVNASSKIHPTEKPLGMYLELIKTIVFPGSQCIVPFLGSGNALRAIYANQCKGFGYDLNQDIKNKFLLRVEKDIEQELYRG